MSAKKGIIPVLLAFVLTLSISPAFAGGYNLAGAGAKALAMAGAYRGVADDWSAMYWNPAGLIGQDNTVTLTGKFLFPMVWLTPDVPGSFPGYSGYRNGVEQTTDSKNYIAGAFGLTYRIDDKMTAGLSVFAPAALGADWSNLYTGPPYGYNNTVAYPEKAWQSDIKVIDIHPTFAYKLHDRIRLGLGVAIQYATITLRSPKKIPSGAPFPTEHFYVDATLEGDGMGAGFNLGALFDLTEFMTLGVSYRGKVDLNIEGEVKQDLYHPMNLGIQASKPEMASLFNGGVSSAAPEGTATFPIPMDLGAGVAIDPIDNLTFALDMTWTQWSYVDEVIIELDGTGPTGDPAEDSKLPMQYEDIIKFSFGFDYLVYKPGNLHVRGGYYFDPSPIPPGSLRPSITDVADKHNISLGFEYSPLPKLIIEGYWEHLFSEERTVESEDIDGDGSIDNLAGDWKFQVDTFGLSFGYRF